MIVPLPSVVVVVVVVSDTCAHANGAATATAILSSSCFIVFSFFISFRQGRTFQLPIFPRFRKGRPTILHCTIEDKLACGRVSERLCAARSATRLQHEFRETFDRGDTVELDFDKTRIFTTVFFNAAVASLPQARVP